MPNSPANATPLHLDTGQSLNRAIREMLSNAFTQAINNEGTILYTEDIEGVHQMRVGFRRLRAALRLLRKVIPKEQANGVIAPLKPLLTQLGEARDWDVFQFETLQPIVIASGDDRLLTVQEECKQVRQRCYQQLRTTLNSGEYNRSMQQLFHWIDRYQWEQRDNHQQQRLLQRSAQRFAHKRLQRQHDRLLGYDEGLQQEDSVALHDLRIEIKKQRYAIEFFRSLFPDHHLPPYQKRLKRLQDSLGVANDLTTADRLLGQLATTAWESPVRQQIDTALQHHGTSTTQQWQQLWSQFKEAGFPLV